MIFMGEYVLYTNEVTLNRVVTKGFDPLFWFKINLACPSAPK